jgi:transposase
MRAILMRHRAALINQMHGLLGERGLTIARSPQAFKRAIPELLRTSADELTSFCQTLRTELRNTWLRSWSVCISSKLDQVIHETPNALQEDRPGTLVSARSPPRPRPSLAQWATPGSPTTADIWPPSSVWCLDSIPPAASLACKASADAATLTCARC